MLVWMPYYNLQTYLFTIMPACTDITNRMRVGVHVQGTRLVQTQDARPAGPRHTYVSMQVCK